MTPKHYIALRSSDYKIVMPDVSEKPKESEWLPCKDFDAFAKPQETYKNPIWVEYSKSVQQAIANAPEFKDQELGNNLLVASAQRAFTGAIVIVKHDHPYPVDLSGYKAETEKEEMCESECANCQYENWETCLENKPRKKLVVLTKKLKQDDFPNYQAYRLALDKQDSAHTEGSDKDVIEAISRKIIAIPDNLPEHEVFSFDEVVKFTQTLIAQYRTGNENIQQKSLIEETLRLLIISRKNKY